MKKLLMLGGSMQQIPAIQMAKELGYYVVTCDYLPENPGHAYADEYYNVSTTDLDGVLALAQKLNIDGIVAYASDPAAPTAAYVAEKMGLVGNSYESAVRANNKYLMRESFSKADVPCPKYMVATPNTLNTPAVLDGLRDFQYPIIIKPSDRSGSLGVSKICTPGEYYPAIKQAMDVSFRHEAMIEEFIEGREISVEFISYRGHHYPLQITDKVTTGAPHFVELEHHQPSSLSKEMYVTIYSITENALNALGITNGASHSEYKITPKGRIAIMEIGARMGGDFIGSDLVRLSTGYDFLKGVIEVALGIFKKPNITEHKYSGVYFLCKETEYLLPFFNMWESNHEIRYCEVIDNNLRNVLCSADRSGFFIYQSDRKFELW